MYICISARNASVKSKQFVLLTHHLSIDDCGGCLDNKQFCGCARFHNDAAISLLF